MNKVMVVVIGAGLLLVSALASAEMYRWVDSQGKVHYSDRPTQGSRQVEIKVPGQEPAPPAATEADQGSAESEQPTEGLDETMQVRNEQCELAKQRLGSYESTDRLFEQGEAGDKRELNTDERVDAIVKARREVKELCVNVNN